MAAVGVAAFLYTAVVGPLLGAYGRWKSDPQREIVHQRNLFGTFIPDLKRKRIERLLKFSVLFVALFGIFALWTIMSPSPGQ